jgi:hypothetical protein
MSRIWKSVFVAVLVAACSSAAVSAQQAPAPAQAQAQAPSAEDEAEEAFDEKLRAFGYWSGAAFACVGEAKQPEVERKVLDTFNSIARLFGTDRAFFYAAAFGNGTTHKVDPAECPGFLKKFEEATAVRGAQK